MLVVFGDASGPIHSKEMVYIPRRGDMVYLPSRGMGQPYIVTGVCWFLDSDDPHVNLTVEVRS